MKLILSCLTIFILPLSIAGQDAVPRNEHKLVSVLSDPDDPLLPDHSIDRFFLSESWHHMENQTKYLVLIKRMLKPEGQIVMIDFQKKNPAVGPPLQIKIAREDLIKQMESHGFRLIMEYTFCLSVFSEFHREVTARGR